ncbi:hypothetical protein SEA_FLAGSTAFF_41 [Mycobacterium phage FlagStaff]|uniref:Uncharacterized protein n=1 Tax=Mycobacterium phage FlagStaff TaxID=1647304 RepID=A0A0F6WE54_9CAUD|nr:hypothetical protein AVT49_gp41 [Mycobacterium phage FlagStaff]AKF14478.1 hypothetical protein SEA_FLAGSTAFF_41 [Mycobacterium phage FlagStaff]
MTAPKDATPLGEARDWLRERVDDGETCPCCGQFAKVYKRRITANIAAVLVRMWRTAGRDWAYLPALRSAGQDEVIARHWELIEPMPDVEREDGSKRVGYWRLTDVGEAFVRNQTRIPVHARIYNGRMLGYAGEATTNIVESLGHRFDYSELMSA